MKHLKPMSDWCLSKDFNGAERFTDGSRPLMAEINDYVIIVDGYDFDKTDIRAWVSVHFDCEDFIAGLAENKEKGIDIGEILAEHISNGANKEEFERFFRNLALSEVDADGWTSSSKNAEDCSDTVNYNIAP